jgi:hypothetical protein
MKTMRAGIGSLLVVLLVSSCATNREIRTFEDLAAAQPKTLRVLARDNTVYELTTYTAGDSTLAGSGTRIVAGTRSDFSGELPYGDLVYLQVRTGAFWRTTSVVVAALVMVMPRSCSCSIQSMVASPSSTSPSLYVLPEK